jgi:hypothetical protein
VELGRYDRLREGLLSLRDDFLGHQAGQPTLHHDLIWGPDLEQWDEVEFASFTRAHSGFDGVAWEQWSLWPSRWGSSRFWSASPAAAHLVRPFTQLARRGFTLLDEFCDLDSDVGDLPEEFTVYALEFFRLYQFFDEPQHRWLDLVHQWAYRFPTAVLQGECRDWNFSGDVALEDIEAFNQRTIDPPGGGAPYHPHPLCNTLDVDLFTASVEFLNCCLTTGSTLAIRPDCHDGPPEIRLPPLLSTPRWISSELWYGRSLVKKYKKRAENQRRVLDEFERKGWPREIANPFLPDHPPATARETAKRTVEGLNHDHSSPRSLHFRIRRDGDFISWEVIGGSNEDRPNTG